MQGEAVTRVDRDGTLTVLGDLGGGPNGTALGADGALYVANSGGLSAGARGLLARAAHVRRLRPAGRARRRRRDRRRDAPGPAPHRPNDLCFAPDGTLLATDSADWENLPKVGPGRVVAIDGEGRSRVLAELPGMPNGIAFGAGGDVLYLVLSLTRSIVAFDWRDGELTNQRPFCTLPGGMPDGICLDAEGTLSGLRQRRRRDPRVRRRRGAEGDDRAGQAQPADQLLHRGGDLYVTLSIPGHLVAYDVAVSELSLHQGSVSPVATGAR